MLAIQFQSIKQPAERDTRDMWQLREDLKKEQQTQSSLLTEIRKYDKLLETYKTQENKNPEAALEKTLAELKKEAGLTDVRGEGITITIDTLFKEELPGQEIKQISPELLKRLINELNSYDAEFISVNGRRVVNTTVIRDINGVTKIDGYSLRDYPIQINVISKNAAKLHNRIKASSTDENFAIDNLSLSISELQKNMTIPAYDDGIKTDYLKPAASEKGGMK
ncbi:DUF881 domain-containing protein [Metabacillus sp. GX 13764]|uniref:DUF881 domain-containing protein n=1 Tax=Metabacillus kandeliae TaxID=2900151 RepID=UPI001E58863C|nr:DUF881 domain-containing protein [Metabacillus kandeliae]MCD7033887.1 DUF881 domain-containing protein [Metabacillus kandeliae]